MEDKRIVVLGGGGISRLGMALAMASVQGVGLDVYTWTPGMPRPAPAKKVWYTVDSPEVKRMSKG